jgi:phosphatidate cytidylyltransferase
VLKLRILTAALLIPVIVFSVLYLHTSWFSGLVTAIIALAAWEWTVIAGYKTFPARLAYVILIAILLVSVFILPSSELRLILIQLALIWWGFAIYLVCRYQRQAGFAAGLPVPAGIIGLLVLIPPGLSLVVLHAHEPEGILLVLFLLVLIWSADIAAYFSGRRWGKRKLCSRVSPGKSWEGVIRAVTASAVLALIYAAYRQWQGLELLIFMAICIITVLASVLGDLLESLMKRLANVKDSGSILPGHGGMLDRIDSLTAALPVFFCGLWLWGKIV